MDPETSRVAVLGTLGDLYSAGRGYDLLALGRIVEATAPDFLCVEIGRTEWEAGNLGRARVDVRMALLPTVRQSDIVLVPLGPDPTPDHLADSHALAGWRRLATRFFDGLTGLLQRLAARSGAINSEAFGHVCHALCVATTWTAGPEVRAAWQQRNQELANRVLWIAQRDPRRRTLVAVDCRRKHDLEQKLRHEPGVELVTWRKV